MKCKIVRTQKFMWRNFMRLIKSKKVSILHYSIDRYQCICFVMIHNILPLTFLPLTCLEITFFSIVLFKTSSFLG
jgi:hypothetical protein